MAKTLNIVTSAYRCNNEEQDDPILWISHALKNSGADVDVLLRGNAVNYAVKAQDASGLSFGGETQGHPCDIVHDLTALQGTGTKVFAVGEDLRERGLEGAVLVDGITQVDRSGVAELFDAYERIWSW